MDRRFRNKWVELNHRRDDGETLRDILDSMRNEDLVAALAGAGDDDPVTTNVLATELLNRIHRGPFLGASVVAAVVFALIFVLDWIFTGSLFLLEAGARAYILSAFSLAAAICCLVFYQMWRGRLPRLRYALRPRDVY